MKPTELIAETNAAHVTHVTHVTMAATFVAEPIEPALQHLLSESGLQLGVRFAPYNQVFQQLLDPASSLGTNAGGVNVVLLRFEDFVRDIAASVAAGPAISRAGEELADALLGYARRAKLPAIVMLFGPSPAAHASLHDAIARANATLAAKLDGVAGLTLLSLADLPAWAEAEDYDKAGDELAHIPFTDAYFAALALVLARRVHALRVPAHKVLVLDCDNTLWRGVVGEEGVDGISLPPSFLQIQQFALDLLAKGILLCLASKNAEADVLEVLDSRADMMIRREHIVDHRINWEPKPRNLRSLAAALNLGLDSFVFLDDNPVECAQMRAELPQVVTLQVPPDDQVASFLANLWLFDKTAVTDEDKRRTDMYRENAARQAGEEATADIGEFLASLNLAIDIAPPADDEWPRLSQLTQRTNQFNFTTARRSEPELRGMAKEGASDGAIVLRVRVSDRFGDYGLVGMIVAVTRQDAIEVDTLLLSCRVLGRGVEHAMLRRLGELASARRLARVDLPYLFTPKNEPARAFADSVAATFRVDRGSDATYAIPADAACAIAHRPGADPEAVIAARNADSGKAPKAASVAPGLNDRSMRYQKLATEWASGTALLASVRARDSRSRSLPGSAVAAATEVEQRLLALWRSVLAIDDLGVEDDYFALGGTSLLAARLFGEIGRQFGIRLPLTAILESPTVRLLARQLEPQRAVGSGVLIDLRPGSSRTLFLVHDGDGETLLYLNLAKRLPADVGVVGIEPLRRPGVPLAHTSIEAMAAFYVRELRQRQPQGPYLLGGLCAGGVIAYEMAAQLVRAQEPVALLAILDAHAPQARVRAGLAQSHRAARLRHVWASGDGRPASLGHITRAIVTTGAKALNAAKWAVQSRARAWSVRARFALLRSVVADQRPWPTLVPSLSVREIYDSAESRYSPRSASAGLSAMLVRARSGTGDDAPYVDLYADPLLGWEAWPGDIRAIDVDGGHASMLQEPFVASLAAALTPFVKDTRVVEQGAAHPW